MNSIDRLIMEIIPPADYHHRNGFTNTSIIDALDGAEKQAVENRLINLLAIKSDMLIVETLGYMKSQNAVNHLTVMLNEAHDAVDRLILASSIFKITADKSICEIALDASSSIDNNYPTVVHYEYTLMAMFYYMASFHDSRIDNIIRKYIKNKDLLLSYNANRALGLTN